MSDKTDVPTSPTSNAAPPPAATVVAEGKRTEREIELEKELEETRKGKKKAETEASEWQDKARTMKEAQEAAALALHQPKPAVPKKCGWGFFDED